ncbi:MAG TPA: hypothetical protein DEF42_12915 [Desulfosporosinus sp.]|nr:hypothetical protein [Desulfosporosinus sp.]
MVSEVSRVLGVFNTLFYVSVHVRNQHQTLATSGNKEVLDMLDKLIFGSYLKGNSLYGNITKYAPINYPGSARERKVYVTFLEIFYGVHRQM